jgi:hypothetical protein
MVVLVVQVMNMNWCYPVVAVLEEEAIDDVMVSTTTNYDAPTIKEDKRPPTTFRIPEPCRKIG